MFAIYIALYSTLIDDDEDVRDQGAVAVSSLLSAAESDPSTENALTLSLSPPAAKRRLLRFLQARYRTSGSLCIAAIERLTGLQVTSGVMPPSLNSDLVTRMKLRPVAAISMDAQKPQLAVFVEEKQNLYINPVEEAEVWSELLMGLDSEAWDDKVAIALQLWTTNGLSHFLNTLKERKDRPLGLMSQPEIYTLFVRVVLCAKVLMSLPVSASANESAMENLCKGLLEDLLELGQSNGLHMLLLDRLEQVLHQV